MKKRFWAALPVALGALMLFSGCALYGNDRSRTGYLYTYEADGKIVLYNVESLYRENSLSLTFDPDSGEFSFEERNLDVSFQDVAVLDSNTFPRRSFEAIEGYEGLTEKLIALDRKEYPLVQAYALKRDDNTAYGFCNVYSSATGYLSGGGQIDVKKIERSVLFTYSPETDTLTELASIGGGCTVAFNGTHCIYCRNRVYYSWEVGKEGEKKLCEDGAYDTGATSYSYANFYFNEEYCVFLFHRGYSNYKKDYDDFLLFRMNGEKLSQLHVPSNLD